MAKFPGTAPSLLRVQAGNCYLFLWIPKAGNSSQSEAEGKSGVMWIRMLVGGELGGEHNHLLREAQVWAFENPHVANSHMNLNVRSVCLI